jgi:hypothetical protein
VFVENVLNAPDTVSNVVPVLVEVCGDEDFRVACPTDTPYEPYAPSTNQMAEYVAVPCYKLGVSRPYKELEAHTIGEALVSVRQVLKRLYGWSLTAGATLTAANQLFIKPYHLFCTTQAATTSGALTRGVVNSDLINLWSWCYAMQTGSMRLVLKTPAQTTANLGVQLNAGGGTFSQMAVSAAALAINDKTMIPTNIEGYADLQVPVWQPCYARAVPYQTEMPGSFTVSSSYGNPTSVVVSAADAAASVPVVVYRTIGEDFSMFCWMGVPPVCLTSTT